VLSWSQSLYLLLLRCLWFLWFLWCLQRSQRLKQQSLCWLPARSRLPKPAAWQVQSLLRLAFDRYPKPERPPSLHSPKRFLETSVFHPHLFAQPGAQVGHRQWSVAQKQ
jgi:hypothetical protein